MKKDEKYYGEVWFEQDNSKKHFCIMSFNQDELILETNLHSIVKVYKEPKILGVFTGLGHISFIDCKVQTFSSGITETRIYNPKYSFISASHSINTENLKFKEFYVVNNAIVQWVNSAPWYDQTNETLNKKKFADSYLIDSIGLTITIEHYINYLSTERTKVIITNQGLVRFELEEPESVLSAIQLYDQFQKVLQLVFGRSSKFEKFGFKCLGCGVWKELYYNDQRLSKSTNTFVHTEYEKIKESLQAILTASYTDEKFKFCLDKLMENFMSRHTSHNKRFINSITSFEAFCKAFSKENKGNKPTLKSYIEKYEKVFKEIGKISDDNWKIFPQKIVRSRDFHVHSNIGNKDIFSEFDLLYISFLLDFVIAYLLLSKLDVKQELLGKYIQHGKSVFVDMKRTNTILGADPLA